MRVEEVYGGRKDSEYMSTVTTGASLLREFIAQEVGILSGTMTFSLCTLIEEGFNLVDKLLVGRLDL